MKINPKRAVNSRSKKEIWANVYSRVHLHTEIRQSGAENIPGTQSPRVKRVKQHARAELMANQQVQHSEKAVDQT